jgi:hypothetical protein
VPFTRAAVPAVDIAAGRLTVDPPEEVEAGEETEAHAADGRGGTGQDAGKTP